MGALQMFSDALSATGVPEEEELFGASEGAAAEPSNAAEASAARQTVVELAWPRLAAPVLSRRRSPIRRRAMRRGPSSDSRSAAG